MRFSFSLGLIALLVAAVWLGTKKPGIFAGVPVLGS
jgi:hypothetical protein